MAKIELWVIMDINKKAIACGSPRNRSMRLIESLKDSPMRIIMYGTEKRAISGFSGGNGFYDETNGYLRDTYKNKDYSSICIPVKVNLSFER